MSTTSDRAYPGYSRINWFLTRCLASRTCSSAWLGGYSLGGHQQDIRSAYTLTYLASLERAQYSSSRVNDRCTADATSSIHHREWRNDEQASDQRWTCFDLSKWEQGQAHLFLLYLAVEADVLSELYNYDELETDNTVTSDKGLISHRHE